MAFRVQSCPDVIPHVMHACFVYNTKVVSVKTIVLFGLAFNSAGCLCRLSLALFKLKNGTTNRTNKPVRQTLIVCLLSKRQKRAIRLYCTLFKSAHNMRFNLKGKQHQSIQNLFLTTVWLACEIKNILTH